MFKKMIRDVKEKELIGCIEDYRSPGVSFSLLINTILHIDPLEIGETRAVLTSS